MVQMAKWMNILADFEDGPKEDGPPVRQYSTTQRVFFAETTLYIATAPSVLFNDTRVFVAVGEHKRQRTYHLATRLLFARVVKGERERWGNL